MTKSVVAMLFAAIASGACCGRARAQGDVLFPGSTAQGDILRGEGVMYKGAAVLHLNAAKARSIDADTRMRFNEYVYNSYREHLRLRSARIARSAASRNASQAEIQRRLREAPTESDVAGGDALNVALVDLADPRIQASAWEASKVPLPNGASRTIPFQYASVGGTLAMRRLDVGDAWPVALRYKSLEELRRAYRQAVATLLEQCREHRLTPEAVEAVGAAARALGVKADATIPQSSGEYRQVASQFTASLERSARALTRTAYVEDLLGELDGFRGETVADLLDLMRRYNLHFGPAESPEERGMYQTLYPLLRQQRKLLGIKEDIAERRGTTSATLVDAESGRRAVEKNVLGAWTRIGISGEESRIWLFPDGRVGDRNGRRADNGSWTYDGKSLVITWLNTKEPGKFVRIRAVVSANGRSYSGTYKNGTKVWGRKLADD